MFLNQIYNSEEFILQFIINKNINKNKVSQLFVNNSITSSNIENRKNYL